MALLKDHVASHRIVLHTTDITLLEVKRHIRERVLERRRELARVKKDLVRWAKAAPKLVPTADVDFDPEAIATELFRQFECFLRDQCGAEVHRALAVPPGVIFDAYFDRKPPFDIEGSKEFPDAFVLEALRQWSRQHEDRIYVVTRDKAINRAASSDECLLELGDIQEVLTRAAADLGPEAETIGKALLYAPAFDSSFEAALRIQMKEVGYVYLGDLPEGEALEGDFLNVEAITNWSVVALSPYRVTLILEALVKVSVEVEFENRDRAVFDREDGLWVGAESASTAVDDEVNIEIVVVVDGSTGTVCDAKILTQEINIYGPS